MLISYQKMESENFNIAASMGLQSLQHEPQRLISEADKLNAELESLVMDNYRIFVENLTCSAHLRSEDRKLGDIASDLSEELHLLNQQCTAFRDRVSHFVNLHKRNRKTLQHHMQLLELLEVPQLVDACTRNGFYEEALELSNFVNGLERRHLLAAEVRLTNEGISKGGAGVVQNIVNEVHHTLLGLRQHVLQQLTDNSSLPKQIQLLSTLRKLEGLLIDRQLALERYNNDIILKMNELEREAFRKHLMSCVETKLQMEYLEARSKWLKKLTEKIVYGSFNKNGNSNNEIFDNSNENIETITATSQFSSNNGSSNSTLGPYGKTIEMLEMSRTSWFTIITQFNALFEESNGSIPTQSILGTWTQRQVHKLLLDTQLALHQIDDGASYRSILEQTFFFANRMSQVGCDFSPLILPVFKDALLRRMKEEWNVSVANFKSMIATERFHLIIDNHSKEQVVPLYLAQSTEASNSESSLQHQHPKSVNESHPPEDLLRFPPLAYLLNSFLNGLNFIRDCPILDCYPDVLAALSIALTHACHFLVDLADDIRVRGMKYIDKGITVNKLVATRSAAIEEEGEEEVGRSSVTAANNNNEETIPTSNNRSIPHSNLKKLSSRNVLLNTSSTLTTTDVVYSMDVLYGDAMLTLLVHHVLHCLVQIYPTATSSTDSSFSGVAVASTASAIRFERPDIDAVKSECAKLLQSANLIITKDFVATNGTSNNNLEGLSSTDHQKYNLVTNHTINNKAL